MNSKYDLIPREKCAYNWWHGLQWHQWHHMQTEIWRISRFSKYPVDSSLAQRWSKMFRCLRNRAERSSVCRVSTYNNRLISFSNVSLTIRRPCSHFLQNLFKPDHLAKEGIEAIAAESQHERYIYSVYVWLPSVYITPRWSQSLIIYFRINVLTISDLVFSSISNTKCKQ